MYCFNGWSGHAGIKQWARFGALLFSSAVKSVERRIDAAGFRAHTRQNCIEKEYRL